MNIHEYQAKTIFEKYGIAVPVGKVIFSSAEIKEVLDNLSNYQLNFPLVIKAQIHAGGRGKAGGVKIVKTIEEAESAANAMLGSNLITHQTGAQGQIVRKLYFEQASQIEKEYYLSLVIDRSTSKITFIASTEGGMDIEQVAHSTPEKIITIAIEPAVGLEPFVIRTIGYRMGWNNNQIKQVTPIIYGMYKAFIETDASQIEINPLIENKEGKFIALDAKMNFDDNGLFRQTNIREMRDPDEEEPLETEATKYGLTYIKMEGNIGCMVNGAGLAMATMDIIKYYGGDPANFLDVGGGASAEAVTQAFKIILSDKKVEGILVNIFGGIMRCNIIAEGILTAAKATNINIPVVVRLVGTNYELGRQMLEESDLKIITAEELSEAAQKIIILVKEQKNGGISK